MTGAQAQSAAANPAGAAWRLAALTALAMALTALTAAGPTLHLAYGGWMLWGIFAAGGAGIWAALRLADKVDARHALLVILVGALAMRLALLFAAPYLSTDIYRYVWDGRVQAAGINPYRYMPAAPELAPLRDTAIFPNINRPDTAVTIYPPMAQAVFLVVTRILGESVVAMKLGLIAFEALTVAALIGLLRRLGQPLARVAVYAWHPLAIWEIAGSGHIDAAMSALLIAGLSLFLRGSSAPLPPSAFRAERNGVTGGRGLQRVNNADTTTDIAPGQHSARRGPSPQPAPRKRGEGARRRLDDASRCKPTLLAGFVVTLAALIKPTALLALPVLWRPWNWRLPAVVALTIGLAYLPYLSVGRGVLGYLGGYIGEEGFASGQGFALLWLMESYTGFLPSAVYVYAAIAAAVMAGLALAVGFRRDRSARTAVICLSWLLATFLILSSPHYPWYFLPLVPMLALYPMATGWVLTLGAPLLYDSAAGTGWLDANVRLALITFAPVAALAFDAWRLRRFPLNRNAAGETHARNPVGAADPA
jgi:hypothetical protein